MVALGVIQGMLNSLESAVSNNRRGIISYSPSIKCAKQQMSKTDPLLRTRSQAPSEPSFERSDERCDFRSFCRHRRYSHADLFRRTQLIVRRFPYTTTVLTKLCEDASGFYSAYEHQSLQNQGCCYRQAFRSLTKQCVTSIATSSDAHRLEGRFHM